MGSTYFPNARLNLSFLPVRDWSSSSASLSEVHPSTSWSAEFRDIVCDKTLWQHPGDTCPAFLHPLIEFFNCHVICSNLAPTKRRGKANTKQMKSTKVQTLGELRMHDTANWWAGLFVCVYSWSHGLLLVARRVWHWLATVVDSMQELIHDICWPSPQGTHTEQIRSR